MLLLRIIWLQCLQQNTTFYHSHLYFSFPPCLTSYNRIPCTTATVSLVWIGQWTHSPATSRCRSVPGNTMNAQIAPVRFHCVRLLDPFPLCKIILHRLLVLLSCHRHLLHEIAGPARPLPPPLLFWVWFWFWFCCCQFGRGALFVLLIIWYLIAPLPPAAG